MNSNPLNTVVETRDVNKRFILTAATALVALFLAGIVAAWFLYEGPLRKNMAELPNYDLSAFPKPRLQAYPREDLAALRAHEGQVLQSYSWKDHDHARLPIERTLELAAKKHLIPSSKNGGADER